MVTPSFTPRSDHSLLFRRMEGQAENFIPRGQNSPWGTTSPLGSKFALRGEVKNGPLEIWTKADPKSTYRQIFEYMLVMAEIFGLHTKCNGTYIKVTKRHFSTYI
jgi:hypothetical protein